MWQARKEDEPILLSRPFRVCKAKDKVAAPKPWFKKLADQDVDKARRKQARGSLPDALARKVPQRADGAHCRDWLRTGPFAAACRCTASRRSSTMELNATELICATSRTDVCAPVEHTASAGGRDVLLYANKSVIGELRHVRVEGAHCRCPYVVGGNARSPYIFFIARGKV